ncbi:hypothetical protein [Mycobacterium sp. Aquia_213]|uniref:hypothetical protein n=1 Tax=Mycobacterium sp. Aquia_213 TaxID=2991728 RepID=UPI002270ED07|nr:hypothetical protein [Mycobacterium sp. Aquia_213]WAC90195.1 hypothetical protein LMQ14_20005 [Mycobacterium sp. Aquia_213]
MTAVAGVPALSALLSWPTDHLTEAAAHWDSVSERSYGVAQRVWRDSMSVDWSGEAAEKLRSATHADLQTTSAAVDQLQAAARVARSGASDLYAARSRVRYAVEDARAAGFEVGEDLSVTDRMTGGSAAQRTARQAQAQAFAADIRQRAAQLVGLDQQVAGKITAAVAGIRDTFPQNPSFGSPPKDNHVHAVDNHWKQDPPPPGPYDPNPRYPGRNGLGQYSDGNTGSADGAAAAEKALQDEEAATGRQLLRQQIRVTVIDPQTGQPIYRYYDALEPVPGHPGEYTGIEVKSGTASLSPNQRVFDGQVSPQNPAKGTLNGQPVEVIGTRELRAPQFAPEPLPRVGEPLPPRVPEPPPPPVAPRPVAPPPPPVVAPRPSSGGFGGGGGGGAGIPGLGIGGQHVPTEVPD